MFEELLLKPEDFVFVRKQAPVHTWVNKSEDFEILQTLSGQPSSYSINWYSSLTKHNLSYTILDNAANETALTSFKSLKEASICAQTMLKDMISTKQHKNMDLGMQRRSIAYHTIQHESHISPSSQFEIIGNRKGWECNADLEKLEITPKVYKFKTKKEIVSYLYNAVSQELNALFDWQIYTETKEELQSKQTDPLLLDISAQSLFKKDPSWWALFVKPEIDLSKIF